MTAENWSHDSNEWGLPGNLTGGEAKALLAMIIGNGVDMEDIHQFVLVVTLKCRKCGEPHKLSMNGNGGSTGTMTLLMEATGAMISHGLGGDDDDV